MALACSVVRPMQTKGFLALRYLNDFVGVEATLDRAMEVFTYFINISKRIRPDVSPEKFVFPVHDLVWLGFHIDAVTLPQSKVDEILEESKEW